MLVRGNKSEITEYYMEKVTEMRDNLKEWLENITIESLTLLERFFMKDFATPDYIMDIIRKINEDLDPELRYTDDELQKIHDDIEYYSRDPEAYLDQIMYDIDYKHLYYNDIRTNIMSIKRRYELLKGKRFDIIHTIDNMISDYIILSKTTSDGQDISMVMNIFDYIGNIRCGDYYIDRPIKEVNLYPYLENDGEFLIDEYMYALVNNIILIGVPTSLITRADYIDRCPGRFIDHDINHTKTMMKYTDVLDHIDEIRNVYDLILTNKKFTDLQREIAIIGLWILVHEFYVYPRSNKEDTYEQILIREKWVYEEDKNEGDDIVYDIFTGYSVDTRKYKNILLKAIRKIDNVEFYRLFNTKKATMKGYVLHNANEKKLDFVAIVPEDKGKYHRIIIINSRLAKLFVWIALGLFYSN